ncbi:type II toxin-antitoxin system HipA family toxin [Leucobacter albus]
MVLGDNTVVAGRLSASFYGGRSLGGTRFAYDRDYLLNPGAYALDPKLPLRAGTFQSGEDRKIFGAFEDLMPDDWGRRLIQADLAREAGTRAPIGEFDYLALASDATRLGSVRFRTIPAGPWLGVAKLTERGISDIDEIAAAAARFEQHQATDRDLELLGAPGSSIGGARPKVSVSLGGRLRIIKLPSERDFGIDAEAWEYVAMRLASFAGINVQRGKLVRVGEQKSSLVLDRFDRGSEGQRLGYISARTAMELGEQDHGSVTYEHLADTVGVLVPGRREQGADLFKRVALTVLINNVDDHWKNHGFLRDSVGWGLSPAFDINPSPSRGVVYSRPITAGDDPRARDIRNLFNSAAAYGLRADEGAGLIGQVVAAVKQWPVVATDTGISVAEIARMSVAFDEDQLGHAARIAGKTGLNRAIVDLGGARPSHLESGRVSGPERDSSGAPDSLGSHAAPTVWVRPHARGGKRVEGFRRKKR